MLTSSLLKQMSKEQTTGNNRTFKGLSFFWVKKANAPVLKLGFDG